jgi:hypothetical protein
MAHGDDTFVTLAERLESAGEVVQSYSGFRSYILLPRAARTCLCTVGRAAVAAAVMLGWAREGRRFSGWRGLGVFTHADSFFGFDGHVGWCVRRRLDG